MSRQLLAISALLMFVSGCETLPLHRSDTRLHQMDAQWWLEPTQSRLRGGEPFAAAMPTPKNPQAVQLAQAGGHRDPDRQESGFGDGFDTGMVEALGPPSPFQVRPPAPSPPPHQQDKSRTNQHVHSAGNEEELIPPPKRQAEPVMASPEPEASTSGIIHVINKPQTDAPLVDALRNFSAGRSAEALRNLEAFDKSTQDQLLRLLPVVTGLAQARAPSAKESAAMLAQLERAADELRPKAELSIQKICFCEEIKRFGQYKALPKAHYFQPGKWVEVYVELANFMSESLGSSYQIQLSSRVTIRQANGASLWQPKVRNGSIRDRSLTPRHDFHCTYGLVLPPDIPPGIHQLMIEIVDVPTGRKVEGVLDLPIALPAS